jgi:D-glycero-alpha-D-manno-heptose-7-phosphate kinase
MLQALQALKNYMPTKRELALQAIHVEQNMIGEHVGSQDQTAAAFGGLNKIEFSEMQTFEVDPIIISRERLQELQNNLLLCFTGFARTASDVAEKQIEVTPHKEKVLKTMRDLCDEAFLLLTNSSESLDSFGKMLGEQWKIKRGLTDLISNSEIDAIYSSGIKAGALGGKLLGAGGGGFMLFYAPKDKHEQIKEVLKGKLFVPFRFETTGAKIIYFSHE